MIGGILAVAAALASARLFAQRKRAEAATRQSEGRFRTFAEASSDWFWETGPDHRYSYLSGSVSRATGYLPEHWIDRNRLDLVEEQDRSDEAWQKHLAELRAHLPFRDFRHAYPRLDGTKGWVSVSGKPVFDDCGTFIGYRGSGSEISTKSPWTSVFRKSPNRRGPPNSVCVWRWNPWKTPSCCTTRKTAS